MERFLIFQPQVNTKGVYVAQTVSHLEHEDWWEINSVQLDSPRYKPAVLVPYMIWEWNMGSLGTPSRCLPSSTPGDILWNHIDWTNPTNQRSGPGWVFKKYFIKYWLQHYLNYFKNIILLCSFNHIYLYQNFITNRMMS